MYKNLFSLKYKTAVVTGGCGLIGREVAKGLASLGAKVYAADVKQARVKSGSALIKHIYLDLTSEDSLKEALKKIESDGARIDILVNSAYPRTADWGLDFKDVPYASWKKNINDHLGGYFLACRLAAEKMKARKNGSIINLASIYGIVAPDFRIYQGTAMTMPAAYSAIKGGIVAFTRYLATYYARYNIRVNAVSCGGVYDGQDRSFVKKYAQRCPLGRMASPGDIAGAVVYLASDASKYVTGSNLLVDGGWSAW